MKKNLIYVILFSLAFTGAWGEEINLGRVYTYVEGPVVEQRQVFTSDEINRMNVEDLPSLLVGAGVQLLSYGSYGLEQKPSIRGFTDETVRVVIDGVCVNNAQYGTFDFSTINIEDIERIEIVRGGFTEGVSDEGAVGGVIYITTKKQSIGHHFNSDTFIKSFFNFFAPADTVSQSFGYNGQVGSNSFLKAGLKGTYAANKYFFTNYKDLRTQRENAEVFDGSALVNFSHYFGEGNSFNVNEIFYAGNKNIPGPATAKNFGKQKDYDNNFAVQLLFPDLFEKKIKLENTLSWLSNTRFYNDARSDSKHYVNTVKYSAIADFYGWKYFKQAAGVTVDYTYLNSTDDGIHNQFSGTIKASTKFSKGLFSFSVPLAFKFSNRNFAFTPKLGFGFKFKYVDFLIDGYRMIQFPNMDDLYWNGGGFHGNPDLVPESGWGGDFTVNVHNIWLPFSVCVFSNYYENKIQWAGNTPQNVASAFYLGSDFHFEKKFWDGRVCAGGSGEYLYTKLLDKSKITYGKKIMWTPDFTGSVFVAFNYEFAKNAGDVGNGNIEKNNGNNGDRPLGISFRIEGNYVGKRYKSNLNVSYLDPYFLLNVSGEVRIPSGRWTLTPYIRLDNILNTSYESVTDYPMPGINGTLGIKARI